MAFDINFNNSITWGGAKGADSSLIAQNSPIIPDAPKTSETITANPAAGSGISPINMETISKDFFKYLSDKHLRDFYKNAENKNYKTGLYTLQDEQSYCEDKDLATIAYYASPEMPLDELYWHFKKIAHLSDKEINRLFKRLFKEFNEFSAKQNEIARKKIIKLESGYFGDDGILKFIDIVQARDFFCLLRQRCLEENLMPFYDDFYNGSGYKKYIDSLADCKRCHAFNYDLSENINNFFLEGLFSDGIETKLQFRNLAVNTHKTTTLESYRRLHSLQNLDFKNWPPSQQSDFVEACRANENMSEEDYAAFLRQIRDKEIELSAKDSFDIWCGELNITNPGKFATEIRNCKEIKICPATKDEKEIAQFFRDNEAAIAQQDMVVRYAYFDNAKDGDGVLIPNICLVPNNLLDRFHFFDLNLTHSAYSWVNENFSPKKIKEARDTINKYNFPEKGFSYIDRAILPGLSKVDGNLAIDVLCGIYGVFMVLRQTINPISWLSFIVGISLLGEDIETIIQIWKFGTSAQRAMLIGNLIAMLLAPKMIKAAGKFLENCVIGFEARKIGAYSTIIQNKKTGRTYSINPNEETGFVTIIRDDGAAVSFKRNADGGVTALSFKAPKEMIPKKYAQEPQSSASQPAAETAPKSIPSPQASPPRTNPAGTSPAVTSPARTSPAPASPAPSRLPQPARQSAFTLALSDLYKAAKAAGDIDPFKPVSDALDNFAAMVTAAASFAASRLTTDGGAAMLAPLTMPMAPTEPGGALKSPFEAIKTRYQALTDKYSRKTSFTSNELTAYLCECNKLYADLCNCLQNDKTLTLDQKVALISAGENIIEQRYPDIINNISSLAGEEKKSFLPAFLKTAPDEAVANNISMLAWRVKEYITETITDQSNPLNIYKRQESLNKNNLVDYFSRYHKLQELVRMIDARRPGAKLSDGLINDTPISQLLRAYYDDIIAKFGKLNFEDKKKFLLAIFDFVPPEERQLYPEFSEKLREASNTDDLKARRLGYDSDEIAIIRHDYKTHIVSLGGYLKALIEESSGCAELIGFFTLISEKFKILEEEFNKNFCNTETEITPEGLIETTNRIKKLMGEINNLLNGQEFQNLLSRPEIKGFVASNPIIAQFIERLRRVSGEILLQFERIGDILTKDPEKIRSLRENINLNNLIPRITELYAHKSEPVIIRCDLPPGDNFIFASEVHLKSVLINLIDNAIERGKADVINIKVEKLPGKLRITVEDNGTGFPADMLPKIFNERVTGHKEQGGTGTGTFGIIKPITDAHNWTVRAENKNQPFKGAKVIIEAPLE